MVDNFGANQTQWSVTLGDSLSPNQTVTAPNGETRTGVTIVTGGQTQLSSLQSIPSQGFAGWEQQTMIFTANASTEILGFLALGGPSGVPPVGLLDGVSVTATPLPAALFFVAPALAGVFGFSRRKQNKA